MTSINLPKTCNDMTWVRSDLYDKADCLRINNTRGTMQNFLENAHVPEIKTNLVLSTLKSGSSCDTAKWPQLDLYDKVECLKDGVSKAEIQSLIDSSIQISEAKTDSLLSKAKIELSGEIEKASIALDISLRSLLADLKWDVKLSLPKGVNTLGYASVVAGQPSGLVARSTSDIYKEDQYYTKSQNGNMLFKVTAETNANTDLNINFYQTTKTPGTFLGSAIIVPLRSFFTPTESLVNGLYALFDSGATNFSSTPKYTLTIEKCPSNGKFKIVDTPEDGYVYMSYGAGVSTSEISAFAPWLSCRRSLESIVKFPSGTGFSGEFPGLYGDMKSLFPESLGGVLKILDS